MYEKRRVLNGPPLCIGAPGMARSAKDGAVNR
jgi:hypothetical protein